MTSPIIYATPGALATAAAELFVQRARDAIADHGRFAVALSGGSTPKAMYQRLAEHPLSHEVDWTHVQVFWGDERAVPPDHHESNYLMAQQALLEEVPISSAQIHRIRGELPPDEAADDYEAVLRAFFRGTRPRFDLLLLGMGDDGHTASLFPGTAALDEAERWVVANYVPKLADWRITLTLPTINAAACVAFLVAGEAKAERLAEVLNGPRDPHRLPAQAIQPTDGELLWLVDQAAAAGL